MFKKFIVGLLLVMGVVCFADYKTDFKFNLNDKAKIEKGLAEAKAANDKKYIANYTFLNAIVGKDAKTISYLDFKKLVNNKMYVAQCCLIILRFRPFIKNVLADSEINTRPYVKQNYSASIAVLNQIGFETWRKTFINLNMLSDIKSVDRAKNILRIYEKNSNKLTAAEIKIDGSIIKRAWYKNITVSDEWKQLLVKIELMIKSVE